MGNTVFANLHFQSGASRRVGGRTGMAFARGVLENANVRPETEKDTREREREAIQMTKESRSRRGPSTERDRLSRARARARRSIYSLAVETP